jgi:hypothetical protein
MLKILHRELLFYEHGNEPSGSIKGEEFLDQPSNVSSQGLL